MFKKKRAFGTIVKAIIVIFVILLMLIIIPKLFTKILKNVDTLESAHNAACYTSANPAYQNRDANNDGVIDDTTGLTDPSTGKQLDCSNVKPAFALT